jgi:hypothetical protein
MAMIDISLLKPSSDAVQAAHQALRDANDRWFWLEKDASRTDDQTSQANAAIGDAREVYLQALYSLAVTAAKVVEGVELLSELAPEAVSPGETTSPHARNDNVAENEIDLLAQYQADHAERMKSFPVEIVSILEKTSQGFPFALAIALFNLNNLKSDVSDAVLFELRGQIHGHADAAWVRSEIDETERNRLVAYANNFAY